MSQRILIAGIGNVFLGDDAFGVEVVRRLADRPLPCGVTVRDFGICGFDLACAIVDGYDAVVLVDATPRGGAPGTLYVIEPDVNSRIAENGSPPTLDGHTMSPDQVLQFVSALGGPIPPLRLVGCEPAAMANIDEPKTGLSPPVQRAVSDALDLIVSLIDDFCVEPMPEGASAATSG